MLETNQCKELSKIVDKANEFFYKKELPEYIIGVNWDDNDYQWVVSYASNCVNQEYINIWVADTGSGYTIAGHSLGPMDLSSC